MVKVATEIMDLTAEEERNKANLPKNCNIIT